MKKIALIITLVVCATAQTFAQPPIHLTPGDGSVTLTGNGGGISTPTHVDVYRGTTNPPNDLYATFAAGYNYTWVDNTVDNENFYYYRVKVRDENSGTESVFSDVDGTLPSAGSSFYYTFDGVDDQVKILNQNFLNDLSAFEFRFKIDELTPGKNTELFRIKFNKNTSAFANRSAIAVFHTADILKVYIRDERSSFFNEYTINTENVADGNWHHFRIRGLQGSHVFASVDGTDYYQWIHHNGGNNTLYYDGPHDILVGGRSTASATFLKGGIDDLILTNSSDNIIGQWDFNEPTSESTVFDSGPSNWNMVKEGGVASSTSLFEDILTVSYTDSVAVAWNKDVSLTGDPLNYEIYRGVENGPLSFLTNVPNTDTVYVDKSVSNRTLYEYQVRSARPTVTLSSNTDLAKPAKDFDRHLVVDGIGEVQVSESDLFADNSGTIEFWIRADDSDIEAGKSYSVMNKHDASGSLNGFNFVLDRSTIYVQVKDNGVNNVNIRPTNPVSLIDSEWHHVALVYEWGGTSFLYIDGEIQDIEGNTPDFTISSEPFRIGKSPASFWDEFVGEIDEVYVWDQMLDPTQIADQMNKRVAGDADGLLGVWRFDLPVSDAIIYDDGLNEWDGANLDLAHAIDEQSLVATSYDGNNVTVEWDFQLNSVITGYDITRTRVDQPSSPTSLPSQSLGVSSFVDTTPLENVEYEYVVSATTNDGSELATDFVATRNDLGNVLLFDSNGGQVVLSEEVTDNQTGTIEFRFRTNVDPPAGKRYTLLNRHESPGSLNGFNFVLNESNLRVQIKVGGAAVNIDDDRDLIDGEWHHVALVYNWDGATTLFVDGVQEAAVIVSGLEITSEQTRIGASLDTFWEPFEGQFNELRMWSKQLSVAEINASKDIRLPGNTTDLEAVWHFDESTGSIAYDNGPNNYDGTLSGGAGFFREPGTLSFSSISDGFNETVGNNGFIEGSMQIAIEGNSFINAGGIINDNLFSIDNMFDASNDPMNPVLQSLVSGLDPIMTVSVDGKTANLIFNGSATYHINKYSTNSLAISFDPDAFTEDYLVSNSSGASTGISYTLRDNIAPSLDEPIPDFELIVNNDPFLIDLSDFFSDPDLDQELQFFINKDNTFIDHELNGSLLVVEPQGVGDGATEFTVTLSDNNGGEVSDVFVVSVVKIPQEIVFLPIPDIDLATQNQATLIAFANSNLPVEFTLVTGNGTITNGVLTAHETGFFQVAANQPGDDEFAPAMEVYQTLNVVDSRKDDQTITFSDDLSGRTYGDANITLSASASSGLDVTYISTGPVLLNGNTVTIIGAGDASVTAIQNGDDDYNPAPLVTINFSIAKKVLTATADDKTITFGDDLPEFTVSYVGFLEEDDESDIEGLPGTQTTATASSNAGVYDIEVGDGSDNNYTFEYVNGTLTIEKADQEITFSPISDADLAQTSQRTLNATASSGLAIQFDLLRGIGMIEENKVIIEQTGVFEVVAVQTGNENYNAAPLVSQTFLVTNSNKTNQTITFEAIADAQYGDVIELTASASSGMSVNFEVLGGAAILSGNTITLTGLGTYEIEATQDGDNEFNPAPIVINTFEVSKASLTVIAEDQTIAEGGSIPELTLAYDGFKLDDDASVLDELPAASTTATASSAAGDYAITLSGGSDDLYDLTLVNGTLTIEVESVLNVNNVQLTVYPNPTTDRLMVKGGDILTMRLLSMDGKVIQSLQGVNIMNVYNLKHGQYVLQLEEKNGSVSTHVIIKK